MTHPINGIDDLIYVVLFGAHAYAVGEGEGRRRASGDDVFTAFAVAHLACNHSDPTISLGTYDVVFDGAQVAIADPLGMYIRRPNLELFAYRREPPPAEWVRFGRGAEGHFQRLVFVPPDDHEAFLDDITISVGAADEPLTGGYQLLRELEIGPYLLFGETDPIADDEWEVLAPAPAPIACDEAQSCRPVHVARYAAEHAERTGFRAGLNFVSFQDTPARVLRMLTAGGWLGGANFGGDEQRLPELANLLSVYGAGIYFVPPVVPDEPFPGASALRATAPR